jgi:uncharacterized protein YceK
MKLVIILAVLLLVGCNETVRTTEAAERFCEKHQGVIYYHHLNLVVCKDGTVVRGT